MLLLKPRFELNCSQACLASLSSLSLLALLALLPFPLILEEILPRDNIDWALLIMEAGSRAPRSSGARVGRHAAAMDISGSMKDHMRLLATTSKIKFGEHCLLSTIWAYLLVYDEPGLVGVFVNSTK